jgi:hypothetical protein
MFSAETLGGECRRPDAEIVAAVIAPRSPEAHWLPRGTGQEGRDRLLVD